MMGGSSIGDFTRGGQVTLHFIRMIGQVVSKFGKFILGIYIVYIMIKKKQSSVTNLLLLAILLSIMIVIHQKMSLVMSEFTIIQV